MLDALLAGRNFPEMCESLIAHVGEEEAAQRAASAHGNTKATAL